MGKAEVVKARKRTEVIKAKRRKKAG